MDKKLSNEKALELDNKALEEAMHVFVNEKTNVTMAKLMEQIRKSRFLVPAEFPRDMQKQIAEKIKNGGKIDVKTAPKMYPVMVQNNKGERFAPAYTSREHLPKDQNYQAILNVTWDEVLRIASEEKLKLSGVLLNPATDKMILHPKFLEAMKKLKDGVPPTREVKMTKAQFQVFARKNVEWGIIPKNVFTGKADFMNRLDEEREECIAAFYRQPYGDKIPCPYTAKDFDVMVLNINEETCVASVELPEKNTVAQMALALYIIWNPKTDEMHYFLIEKGQPDQENVLSCITPDGKHQELQTAPSAGSELVTILDLLREEKEEQASS